MEQVPHPFQSQYFIDKIGTIFLAESPEELQKCLELGCTVATPEQVEASFADKARTMEAIATFTARIEREMHE